MTKYTYEYTYKEAKKYKTRMDFYNNCRRGYEAAHKNNWIKDYTWFKPVNTKPLHYWKIIKIAITKLKNIKVKWNSTVIVYEDILQHVKTIG